jgi:hypothetical protein
MIEGFPVRGIRTLAQSNRGIRIKAVRLSLHLGRGKNIVGSDATVKSSDNAKTRTIEIFNTFPEPTTGTSTLTVDDI